MQNPLWKLTALTGVIGAGVLVVLQAQQSLSRPDAAVSVEQFAPLPESGPERKQPERKPAAEASLPPQNEPQPTLAAAQPPAAEPTEATDPFAFLYGASAAKSSLAAPSPTLESAPEQSAEPEQPLEPEPAQSEPFLARPLVVGSLEHDDLLPQSEPEPTLAADVPALRKLPAELNAPVLLAPPQSEEPDADTASMANGVELAGALVPVTDAPAPAQNGVQFAADEREAEPVDAGSEPQLFAQAGATPQGRTRGTPPPAVPAAEAGGDPFDLFGSPANTPAPPPAAGEPVESPDVLPPGADNDPFFPAPISGTQPPAGPRDRTRATPAAPLDATLPPGNAPALNPNPNDDSTADLFLPPGGNNSPGLVVPQGADATSDLFLPPGNNGPTPSADALNAPAFPDAPATPAPRTRPAAPVTEEPLFLPQSPPAGAPASNNLQPSPAGNVLPPSTEEPLFLPESQPQAGRPATPTPAANPVRTRETFIPEEPSFAGQPVTPQMPPVQPVMPPQTEPTPTIVPRSSIPNNAPPSNAPRSSIPVTAPPSNPSYPEFPNTAPPANAPRTSIPAGGPPANAPRSNGSNTGYLQPDFPPTTPSFESPPVTQPATPSFDSSPSTPTFNSPPATPSTPMSLPAFPELPSGTGTGSGMPVRSPVDATPGAPSDLTGTGTLDSATPSGALQPELQIEKDAPPRAVLNQPLVYNIRVRNVGRSAAHQVIVEDSIPRGSTLRGTIPEAEMDPRDKHLVWRLGTLQPGEEKLIRVQIIPTEPGEIGSVATVRFVGRVAARTVITAPRIKLELVGPVETAVGDTPAYRFRVTNTGDGDAAQVVLQNIIPAVFEHPSGNDLEYDVGTLKAGQSRDVELVVSAQQAGQATNSAVVLVNGEVHDRVAADVIVLGSRLSLERTGPEKRFVNRPANYVTQITNQSSQPLRNITIVEQLPAGMELAAVPEHGRFDPARRTITWTLPQLGPQESKQIKTVLAARDPGAYSSTIQAWDASGNRAEVASQLQVAGFSSLKVDVAQTSQGGGEVAVGEQVALRLTVANRGSAPASDVITEFEIPPELEFVDARPQTYTLNGAKVRFESIPTLDVNGEQTIDIVCVARQPGTPRIAASLWSKEQNPIRQEEPVVVFREEP